jgi:hypothetical protein
MPLFPLLVAFQNASVPMPFGATAPIPVMTERRSRSGSEVITPTPP